MAKIFITGMTAQQASAKSNSTSKSFAGVINDVLVASGHYVVWGAPSVTMTEVELDQYDSVLVGVSPIGSMAANRVYGALHVIDVAKRLNKLTMFLDAPNASQILPNLKAVINNPASFTKSFFSYRKEYQAVVSDTELLDRLLGVVKYLYEDSWATTIYPRLPWKLEADIKLPPNAKASLHGMSFDAFLLNPTPVPVESRKDKWVVDNYNKWAEDLVKTISLPNFPMKWRKNSSDSEVEEQISRSVGCILAPAQREGTWWSYRHIQALNTSTPIVTDWRESHMVGEPWGILASTIDSMSPESRSLVATAQLESYLVWTPTKVEAVNKLELVLRISQETK